MQKFNKLNEKDLINARIYTAMTPVVLFVFGLLTSLSVIYSSLLFTWPSVCSIFMTLYYTKIQKFGMLTITGIVCGPFFLLTGYAWIELVGWTLGGILAGVVLKAGQYKSFKVTFLSYVCFCLGMMGCPVSLWIVGQSYWENIHDSMGDQYVEVLQSMIPSWTVYVEFLISFAGRICDALLGHKMLKKHFRRAGIV